MQERKIKKWPRIVKFNGDIKLGGVTVADGVADDYWLESVGENCEGKTSEAGCCASCQ